MFLLIGTAEEIIYMLFTKKTGFCEEYFFSFHFPFTLFDGRPTTKFGSPDRCAVGRGYSCLPEHLNPLSRLKDISIFTISNHETTTHHPDLLFDIPFPLPSLSFCTLG